MKARILPVCLLIGLSFLSCKKDASPEQPKTSADYLVGTYKAYGYRTYRVEDCNCHFQSSTGPNQDSFNVRVDRVNDTTVNIDMVSISGQTRPFHVQGVKLRKEADGIYFYGFARGNGFYSNTNNGGQYEFETSRIYAEFDMSIRSVNPDCLAACGYHPVNNNDSTLAMKVVDMISFTAMKK